MAYKASTNSIYGGYFTSTAPGPKKGYLDGEAKTAVGVGVWGDLFGAEVHGSVYGTYTEGGNYALYSNGTVFKTDLDVHLQDTDDNSMAVFYTNVSTDVTVQTSGYSTLSAGRCTIEFDENFKKIVSPDVPVVITVTPIGNSNGVFVSEVRSDGFSVVENNDGKSDVQIAFIAIGRRAGYESPDLPQEVVSADYVSKLSRGLHNDADILTDGEGLYYENGQLYVGLHSSVLPSPDKSRDEDARRIEEERLRQAEIAEKASQVKDVPAGVSPLTGSAVPASDQQQEN
jgi:hypothetical protein